MNDELLKKVESLLENPELKRLEIEAASAKINVVRDHFDMLERCIMVTQNLYKTELDGYNKGLDIIKFLFPISITGLLAGLTIQGSSFKTDILAIVSGLFALILLILLIIIFYKRNVIIKKQKADNDKLGTAFLQWQKISEISKKADLAMLTDDFEKMKEVFVDLDDIQKNNIKMKKNN